VAAVGADAILYQPAHRLETPNGPKVASTLLVGLGVRIIEQGGGAAPSALSLHHTHRVVGR
jgi:hypothetical protein